MKDTKYTCNKTPCVGIWWYTNEEIWARFIPAKLAKMDPTGKYITLGSRINLDNAWKQIVEENAKDPAQLIHQDYKIFHYGSIVYNQHDDCYQIICDGAIIDDRKFQNIIVPYFGLQGSLYEFVLRMD